MTLLFKTIISPADRQVRAVEWGGFELILEIIGRHIDNAEVCQWGCEALWEITVGNSKQITPSTQNSTY